MFLTEPEPPRGLPTDIRPGVRRIVADNPGRMTYFGTNTYLIDTDAGVVALDPGPDLPGHVADVLRAAPNIARILLTHTHRDHLGAVAALREATGAPVAAWHRSATTSFTPDIPLRDGEAIGPFTAVFTPGHAADHVCFAWKDALFSGDHVMSWSSSIVSPPQGDMAAYFGALARLLGRDDAVYLPGHGPKLPEPRRLVRGLLDHRLAREASILGALGPRPLSTLSLMDRLYSQTDPYLRVAAERNVLAHLLKLEGEGLAARAGECWASA